VEEGHLTGNVSTAGGVCLLSHQWTWLKLVCPRDFFCRANNHKTPKLFFPFIITTKIIFFLSEFFQRFSFLDNKNLIWNVDIFLPSFIHGKISNWKKIFAFFAKKKKVEKQTIGTKYFFCFKLFRHAILIYVIAMLKIHM